MQPIRDHGRTERRQLITDTPTVVNLDAARRRRAARNWHRLMRPARPPVGWTVDINPTDDGPEAA